MIIYIRLNADHRTGFPLLYSDFVQCGCKKGTSVGHFQQITLLDAGVIYQKSIDITDSFVAVAIGQKAQMTAIDR